MGFTLSLNTYYEVLKKPHVFFYLLPPHPHPGPMLGMHVRHDVSKLQLQKKREGYKLEEIINGMMEGE